MAEGKSDVLGNFKLVDASSSEKRKYAVSFRYFKYLTLRKKYPKMLYQPDKLTVVDAHSVLEGNVAADACLPLPEFDDRHPVISRRRRPDNKDRTVPVQSTVSRDSDLISAPLGVLRRCTW